MIDVMRPQFNTFCQLNELLMLSISPMGIIDHAQMLKIKKVHAQYVIQLKYMCVIYLNVVLKLDLWASVFLLLLCIEQKTPSSSAYSMR